MKTNLAVFFGGMSVEHEISIISAVQAMHAVNRDRFTVIPVYMTKNGEFYTGDALFEMEHYKDIPALLTKCSPIYITRQNGSVLIYPLKTGFLKKPQPLHTIDIAFPVVHGTNCEDGTLQGLFELLSLPYTGCDVLGSAAGMDKVVFKNILEANQIPTLPCIYFYAKQWVADKTELVKKIAAEIGYPLIVKPANLGSSVGISKVENEDQLEEAVSLAMSFAQKILVERAVTSLREINCSVLGDVDECRASVCEEPVMSDEILSYTDKYMSGSKSSSSKGMSGLKRKVPAEISEEKRDEIQNLARRTFLALGGNGVVRIDFLMDTGDNDRVYVNEINTLPGSLAFYLWDASGLPYDQLIDRLVELGFKRARSKNNLMFTYDTNILSGMGSFGAKGSKG